MTYFFIDIDGTVANATRRFLEAGKEPHRHEKEKYTEWLKKVQNADSLMKDVPVKGMRSLLWALQSYGAEVCYLTAREEQWRQVTEKWLRKHEINGPKVYMRPNNNWQDAGTLKENIIDALVQQYPGDVVIVDDDPLGELQAVCKRRGWTLLKAAVGGV